MKIKQNNSTDAILCSLNNIKLSRCGSNSSEQGSDPAPSLKTLSKKPVSNLPFPAKVLEYAVAVQLQKSLDNVDHLYPFQSGFRPWTESTLVVALNEASGEMFKRVIASLLILLDGF